MGAGRASSPSGTVSASEPLDDAGRVAEQLMQLGRALRSPP